MTDLHSSVPRVTLIGQLLNRANLNANFGYPYTDVPNWTLQRCWDDGQELDQQIENKLKYTVFGGRTLRAG